MACRYTIAPRPPTSRVVQRLHIAPSQIVLIRLLGKYKLVPLSFLREADPSNWASQFFSKLSTATIMHAELLPRKHTAMKQALAGLVFMSCLIS